MLVACWSVKGGAGVSVVAASLAHRLAVESGSALLVDLGGDQPDIVGIAAHRHEGAAEWLATGPAAAADGRCPVEVPVADGLRLLPRGSGPLPAGDRAEKLLALLAGEQRPVVVDCGAPLGCCPAGGGLAQLAAASATRSLLVLRPCLVSLRRALSAPVRPSGLVVVREAGRVLGARDAEEVLAAPVVAELDALPAVARLVDAGLLLARPPLILRQGLRDAA